MKRVNLPLLILLLLLPSGALSQYQIANGTFNGGGGVRSGDHTIYDSAAQAAAARWFLKTQAPSAAINVTVAITNQD